MEISKKTNLRIGLSLAGSICLGIAGTTALKFHSVPSDRARLICAGAGCVGLALWFIGGSRVTALVQADLKGPIACLVNPRYFGLMLMAASMLACAYISFNLQEKVTPVLYCLAGPKTSASVSPLKLKGILFNGDRSSAIVNSELLRAGEQLDGVLISQIYSNSIAVEFRGQEQVIGFQNRPRTGASKSRPSFWLPL